MTMTLIQPAVLPATLLSELKAYLRIDTADDDALLSGLLRAALAQAEDFTGLVLLSSVWRENRVALQTIALGKAPFISLVALTLLDPLGVTTAVALPTVQVSTDMNDEATVKLAVAPLPLSRITLDYIAGMASDWNGLAEALRLGIIRQAVHLYSHRDEPQTAGLALAASALWRPYKRLRLA